MTPTQILNHISQVVNNLPTDWIELTTHRLDIYNEPLAKTEFLERFETLIENNTITQTALNELPTAYDYIRLGHPLSSVLEWALAKLNNLDSKSVISFASKVMPILAVLRKNLLTNKATQLVYEGELPSYFDAQVIKEVYGYTFELRKIASQADLASLQKFEGSRVYFSTHNELGKIDLHNSIDFFVSLYEEKGSIIYVNGEENKSYISEIQHVRRRESIAMTPADCLQALQELIGTTTDSTTKKSKATKQLVTDLIEQITNTTSKVIVGSSGLSVQYAIMMGLVHEAQEKHSGKAIKFIVPPNCYGGTNDQARRVAACLPHVEVMDLPVDGENDMVKSVDAVLEEVAKLDAVPYIIAEIPTNPRVEVPNLTQLKEALTKVRKTADGDTAIAPVFILDQTFCPNVSFWADNQILSTVQVISYVSGSKFPSGGKCTAGYAVANQKAAHLMDKLEQHLWLCDNEATGLQLAILAEQLPSMLQRIEEAYQNTRKFVNFIKDVLPTAKINFVSEDLAAQGFTPSVFSLDLPTKGNTAEERELYKRNLNDKLIHMMITQLPKESKYCVSYGQLKGCYWTIPATSTQGTTKEEDKDYIVRVSLSANMNLERHQEVFLDFVKQTGLSMPKKAVTDKD